MSSRVDNAKPRRYERRAVNATRAFFEEHDLIFQEIDLRNDIGKDSVLDLARSGSDAGLSIALQIKGGKKYKRKSGHSIPIDVRLRTIWRNSSLPIFVIVLDPDDNELYWGSLAEMAERASEDTKTVSVWPDTQLTPDGLEQFLDAARLKCLTRRSDPLLNLTSHNPNLISSALFDCLAVGRSDPRYLKLVRSTLTNIPDQRGFLAAVHLLAHATNHPDIFWHRNNIISEETARSIHESYRWSPTEIAMLLARLPEEEECWGRGTIGQSLFHILSVDPSLDWAIDRLMVEAFRVDELTWRSCWVKGPPFGPKWVQTNREIVVIPCFTLSLYLATDAQARLDELTERLPPLTRMSIFPDVASIIEEFGSIDIF